VLRFQASYCKPCARESAALGRLTSAIARARRGAGHPRAGRGGRRPSLHPLQQGHLSCRARSRLTIGNRYGFKGTPYTVVIDRQGEIVARLPGESAVTRLPRLLDEI